MGDDAYPSSKFLVCPYSVQARRQDKSKDHFNFFQSRCGINVECAFGIMVKKWGILRRPMSFTLVHNIAVAFVCMKLHSFGIDNYITRVKPHDRDFRNHDRLFVVPQDHVSENPPKDLKAKV